MTDPAPSRRPRVLVADDNAAVLARSVQLLQECCDIIATARDGPAAVDLAASLAPDVVVLDISMPILNGLEVAGEIRRRGLPVAIVFVSAHDDPEFIEVAQAAGALGYVVKPTLSTDLAAAVLAASDGRSHFPRAS